PTVYVEYLDLPGCRGFLLLNVCPADGNIAVQRFGWYESGDYDRGYQGVTGATEVPGAARMALVSVQRGSVLVIHDLDSGMRVGSIDLGGHGGAGSMVFRDGGKGGKGAELWVRHSDSIAVV